MAQKFSLIVAAKTTGQAGLKRMGNTMQGLQGRLKNVRMAALSAGTAFKALALVLSAGAFTRFLKSSIDQADAFGKLSRQTGIAADTLQSYVNAGKLAGVEQSTIEKGLRRLAQSQREADQGIKTYSESYEALGISVRDVDGNLKDSDVLLGEIADRFRQMPNGATKAALAMEIFGRSGAKMIPMLNEGSEAIKKFSYETSENFAQNAEYFNDQLTTLGIGFDGFRKQMSDALLPALNSIAEAFTQVLSSENDWSGFFKFVEGAIRGIAVTVFGVMKLFQEISILGSTVIGKIREMMQAVENATPEWVKKLIGGGVGMAQELGGRFVTQQKKNLRGVLGDEYVDAAKSRFDQNLVGLQKITVGDSEAGQSYFQKGVEPAAQLNSQVEKLNKNLEKTFGESMKAKLQSFSKSMSDFGGMVGDVVVKSFKGLEDQLVNFTMTGKMAFQDLARSILADMARIAIRATVIRPLMAGIGLASAKGNVFDQGGHVQKYGKGGVVHSPHYFAYGGAGKLGILGEKGSEAILPLSRMANGNLGVEAKGGSGNVVVNVDANQSDVAGDSTQSAELGKVLGAAIQAELLRQKRPGGLLSAA